MENAEKPLDLRWKAEVLPSGFGKCSRFVRSKPVVLTRPITVPAGGHVPTTIVAVRHRACFLALGGATLLNEIADPPVARSAT
ncbi:hypothetical protein K0M31_005278 [Melipona bicolor]|uniref:Uncharacterized protein n=1 Tax=Melipona bicolor TaxID=60889 RepID=A0AA40KMB5_9HYME|nr:hypothetical protein K0M31_005278 [Melipona bicolor]